MTVPTFNVTSDPVNDRVTGTTSASVITSTVGMPRTLAVWPTSSYDWDYGKHVLPKASGAFDASNPFYDYADPANSAETLDWGPGTTGHLRYIDANANRVYARFQAADPGSKPVVYVRGRSDYYYDSGYVSENYVNGYVSNFCGNGVVTLKDSGGTLKAQATNVWACSSFGVSLYDASGNAAPILAGDKVEATFGGRTTVVDGADLQRDLGSHQRPGHRHDQCDRRHRHRGYAAHPGRVAHFLV